MKVFIELGSISFVFWCFGPEARGILAFPPGVDPPALHWNVTSQPLDHQGSPVTALSLIQCVIFPFLQESVFTAAMLFCWLFSHLVLAGMSLPRSLLFWVWVISPSEASLCFPLTAQSESEGCCFC